MASRWRGERKGKGGGGMRVWYRQGGEWRGYGIGDGGLGGMVWEEEGGGQGKGRAERGVGGAERGGGVRWRGRPSLRDALNEERPRM